MEGSKLFRHAENWLNNNPGKNLRDYKKATGYSGPPLKLRQRKGDPIRVSYKGKSSQAQVVRSIREKPKTLEEASYLRQIKRQAKEISQSTLHQFVADGRPSVAEHDVRLASGGTSEYLSISDPDFAAFKTKIESKLPAGYVADIDDVTGGVRIIPEQYHNKFQPTSKQPGFTLEMGGDIDRSLLQISGGSVKLRAAGLGSAAGFITSEEAMTKLREGDYAGAFQAAGTEMVVGEAVTQGAQRVLPKLGNVGRLVAPVARAVGPAAMASTPLQAISKGTDPNKIIAAQQRGGKLSFGLGGVKFTLPELGITEALGGMYEAFMSQ